MVEETHCGTITVHLGVLGSAKGELKLVFMMVVGCGDALRVATESQLQESPCCFTNTAVWSDLHSGNTPIRRNTVVE